MSKKVLNLLERVDSGNCVSGVLSIVADDMNPSNDFHLKELMQSMMRKHCEQFWSCIYRTIIEINCSEPDLMSGELVDEKKLFSEKDLEFYEAIQYIIQIVLDNDISGCPSLDKVLELIHTVFFSLTDESQEAFCKIFEKIWTDEMDFRETYAPNMCTYLMTAAMRLDRSFNSTMTRLSNIIHLFTSRNAVRESFKLIDFSSTQSNTLKALILHAVSLPQFIAQTHGKKLLSIFLTLATSFPRDCFMVLKESLLSLPAGIIRKWGDILMTSNLGCENTDVRTALETEVIQDIMNLCIHAANSRVFTATKILLGSFVHYRKNKDLWERLTELYEPLLFRSLTAVNAKVRRHAVIVFTDCFPLGTSESRDRYSIEDQFKSLVLLCDDDCSEVRSVAVAGILHLISNYYELLPISVTNMIFDHFTNHILYDNQVDVREYCIRGFIELLDNRIVYSQLFPRLSRIWSFVFDRSLRVRRSFLHLLTKLQSIKSFNMMTLFDLNDFLMMMVYDQRNNPMNSINRLYVKFLYPLFWQEKENARVVTRIHNFLVKDSDACIVFLKQSVSSAGIDATLKVIRLLLISLFLCYEGQHYDQPSTRVVQGSDGPEKRKGRGKKRVAKEIAEEEGGQESNQSGFDANVIPTGDRHFQGSLLHAINVLVDRLRGMCSSSERVDGSVYLLSDVTNDRLLSMYGHATEINHEDDMLSFLSFFSYTQIDTISPQFVSVLLSSSQQLLSDHLPLFMQLVYEWGIGQQILDTALQQINRFLQQPNEIDDNETVQNVSMPIKKRKEDISKKKKEKKKKKNDDDDDDGITQLQMTMNQSLAILHSVIDDSINQSSYYSPSLINQLHDILQSIIHSLKSYAFSSQSQSQSHSQSVLQIYHRLLTLLLKIETHLAVSTSLTTTRQQTIEPDKPSSPRSVQINPLIGSIAPSLHDLRVLLSDQLLTMNTMGNYQLSLLQLLLLFAHKSTTLLLIDYDFTEACFSLVRNVSNSLFSGDLQEVKKRMMKEVTEEVTEEDSGMRMMQEYMLHRVMPLLGKWLQALRTVNVSLSEGGWGDELLRRLLRGVLTMLPLECVKAMESDLVSLLRAYPRVLQEIVENEVRMIRGNENMMNVLLLRKIYIKRYELSQTSILLQILLKNIALMTLICDGLHRQLQQANTLPDMVSVLSVLLQCVEVRVQLHLRVSSGCYSPLQAFVTECGERFKETLSAGEGDEARDAVQFVVDVAEEIKKRANESGPEKAKEKEKVKKGGKKGGKKRRTPVIMEVIVSEEEMESEGDKEQPVQTQVEEEGEREGERKQSIHTQLDNKEPDKEYETPTEEVRQEEQEEILLPSVLGTQEEREESKMKRSETIQVGIEEPSLLVVQEESEKEEVLSDSFFDEPEY